MRFVNTYGPLDNLATTRHSGAIACSALSSTRSGNRSTADRAHNFTAASASIARQSPLKVARNYTRPERRRLDLHAPPQAGRQSLRRFSHPRAPRSSAKQQASTQQLVFKSVTSPEDLQQACELRAEAYYEVLPFDQIDLIVGCTMVILMT